MAAIATFGLLSDTYVNGLLTGTKWGVNSLTYSFPTNAAFYGSSYGSGENTNGFEAFTTVQQAAVRSILKQYSSVANFSFLEIAETSTQHAEMRYAESDLPGTAWAYYPTTSVTGGDAWFNNSKNYYDSPTLGNYAWLTIMHETGHALGLKHPHTAYGVFNAMPADRDSLEYTVMSYRSYVGASAGGLSNEGYGYPQSLMMYDIAALQVMYGANYGTNNGNTVYSWNPSTGQQYINGVAQAAPGANRIFMTIWDGGGQDTYDFSNYTTGVKVDLSPGGWTTTSTAQLANLGGGRYAVGNIANALLYQGNPASLIENAVGGTGNDVLIGNVANNRFTGGRGNDSLDGGAGTDTAVYSGLSTDYSIVKNANGSWTIADLRSGSPDGTDTLTNMEYVQFSNTTSLLGSVGTTNQPPVVTAPDVTAKQGQVIAASSMFTVSDPEKNPITKYQFWDGSSEAGSGYFVVGGVARAAGTLIEITAAQLSQVSFLVGSTPDTLSIRAFDGTSWGAWDNLIVKPTVTSTNSPPVVTAAPNITAFKQTLAASSMFTVKDAENNAITKYQFWDDSPGSTTGHFVVGGVVKAADTMIEVTAAQLSQTYFVAGSTADVLSVRAFDGTSWGAWDNLLVKPAPSITPIVTTQNVSAVAKQTVSASSMFTLQGVAASAITKYQFWDDSPEATSGYFVVGGVTKTADTLIEITAAQLAQTYFVAGSTADVLSVRAFDGVKWGSWDNLLVKPGIAGAESTVTAVTAAPNITASKETVSASSMFTVEGTNSNNVTKIQFWDDSPESSSGHFVVGGVAKAADTLIEVTAAQLSQTFFIAGSTADILSVRVFDGTWSAWDNLLVKPAPSITPIVTTQNISAVAKETISPSSMFTLNGVSASAITKYQFWDDSSEATSGHFVVGGVTKAADTMIEVTASQLSQTYFVAGSTPDVLSVRAFDGTKWGSWDNLLVKPSAASSAPGSDQERESDHQHEADEDEADHGHDSFVPTSYLSGNKIVEGASQSDILASSQANETFTGGGGGDVFLFGSYVGHDVITDMQFGSEGHDRVVFQHTGLAGLADLVAHAEQEGGNVIVNIDAENSVTFQGTTLAAILEHRDHFLFIA